MFSLVIERLLTALLSFFFVFGRATNVKSACVTMNPFERTLLGTQLCGSPHKIFSGPLGVVFFFFLEEENPNVNQEDLVLLSNLFFGKTNRQDLQCSLVLFQHSSKTDRPLKPEKLVYPR